MRKLSIGGADAFCPPWILENRSIPSSGRNPARQKSRVRQIEERQVMETVNPATTVWSRDSATVEKRDVWTALKRGFRCRCPRCGQGKLFQGVLTVRERCSVCQTRSRSACERQSS
jgi:hypothetical protein